MKKNKGLSLLLEQPNLVTIKIQNRLPVFTSQNSGTPSTVTLGEIVTQDKSLSQGEAADAVLQMKQRTMYTGPADNVFDAGFETFLKKWQTDNKIISSGKIDKATVCAIWKTSKACLTANKAGTATAPGIAEPKKESKVVKELMGNITNSMTDESRRPDVNECVRLIDTYADQTEIYRKSKSVDTHDKVLAENPTLLNPIKKAIARCFQFNKLRLKMKFAAISQINKDETPFKLKTKSESPKEDKKSNDKKDKLKSEKPKDEVNKSPKDNVPKPQTQPQEKPKKTKSTDNKLDVYSMDKTNATPTQYLMSEIKKEGNFLTFKLNKEGDNSFSPYKFDCTKKDAILINPFTGEQYYRLNNKGLGKMQNLCKTTPVTN